MDVVGITLLVVKGIVSISSTAVISNAVKFTTPITVRAAEKVLVKIGGYVLGGLVGKIAADYAEKETMKVIEELKKLPKIKAEEKPSE